MGGRRWGLIGKVSELWDDEGRRLLAWCGIGEAGVADCEDGDEDGTQRGVEG